MHSYGNLDATTYMYMNSVCPVFFSFHYARGNVILFGLYESIQGLYILDFLMIMLQIHRFLSLWIYGTCISNLRNKKIFFKFNPINYYYPDYLQFDEIIYHLSSLKQNDDEELLVWRVIPVQANNLALWSLVILHV